MRIKKLLAGLLVVILFTAGLSTQQVNADKLKDEIKRSMQETEKRKEALSNFHEEIHKKFDAAGYDASLSFSNDPLFYQEKLEVIVHIKDSNLMKQREKIDAIVKEAAKTHKLGKVEVRIEKAQKNYESEQDKKLRKLHNKIFTVTKDILKEKGLEASGMIISSTPNQNIRIEIRQHDKSINISKLEELIHDEIYAATEEDIKVEVREHIESAEKEIAWMPILQAVHQEMRKHFDEVSGFAHSFHPAPLQIIIKTTLADNRKTRKTAARMEEYVHTIIDVKREELNTKKEPYTVIIRDKKHNKLN
ncbi:hypothetical protein ACFO3D_15145 [Virgibacillus kekensis]|uniref:DUF4030 domain-containing protein n=1 Tax=Virgibacillus kekensis TaxID=202261 RepID=A0ABV9DNY0_9BACI